MRFNTYMSYKNNNNNHSYVPPAPCTDSIDPKEGAPASVLPLEYACYPDPLHSPTVLNGTALPAQALLTHPCEDKRLRSQDKEDDKGQRAEVLRESKLIVLIPPSSSIVRRQ